MSCPACGSNTTGKISVSQYFCWNCFVEFNEAHEIFEIEEDGNLILQGKNN